jgi:hypothetical protein
MAAELPLGYQKLIGDLNLEVRPLRASAAISTAVNRRVNTESKSLFPRGVAIDDTPLGHLEFALRHEGVNLEVIDAAFEHITPEMLTARLRQAPNGEYIRRACFLWEWLTSQKLEAGIAPTGGYVSLFPPADYVVSGVVRRDQTYRVDENALGTPDFCPTVRRRTDPGQPDFEQLMAEASDLIEATRSANIYERAVQYLYLSETRSSFAIEKEVPTGSKEERFVQLLLRVGERESVSEDWLVRLQNAVVRDVFSQEASYRTQQNSLEDRSQRITYLPPAPADMRRAMAGWERFVNSDNVQDPLVKAACASFGFVYLHPFMDGNGRLHRFIIHQVLAQSGLLEDGVVIPVSAVIMKNIPEYHKVLTQYSKPTLGLWEYERGEDRPHVLKRANSRSYRFFDADREVGFLHEMLTQAVRLEIPAELAYLSGYDQALTAVDVAFDLPGKDIGVLVRSIRSNGFELSKGRRKQFPLIPDEALDRIVEIVKESFGGPERSGDLKLD